MTVEHLLRERLKVLCENIGPRPVGSSNNQKAVSYIEKVLKDNGFTVEQQPFDCIEWSAGKASLHISGKEISVRPSDYTLPCDVKADLCTIGSLQELEKAQLQGHIALLHGSLVYEPLMPKNFTFYNPEEHQQIIHLLEKKKPAAILTYAFKEGTPVPIITDGDFDIPCAVISEPVHKVLFKSAGKKAHLIITSRRSPSRAANIIARLHPAADEKLIFSAHIDTAPGTPGALDNGGGVACLLTLSDTLTAKNIQTGIELVFFNGEDYYSAPGETIYLGKYQHMFASVKLAVNCDGVGLKNSTNCFSCFSCPESLHKYILSLASNYPDLVETDPWYQGDHMLFTMQKVPALACTSSGIFDLLENVIHTPNDTIDMIDIQQLLSFTRFLSDICERKF